MWDYAHSHNLNFFDGNIVKYVTRWKHKNGVEDLYKAKQYLDKLIGLEEIERNKQVGNESVYFDLQNEEKERQDRINKMKR